MVEQRLTIDSVRSRSKPRSRPALLAIALLLAGCASTSTVVPVEDSGERTASGRSAADTTANGDKARPGPGTKPSPDSQPNLQPSYTVPTLALLQQSDRAAEQGNLDEAIAYVERAIRMNAKDPELWLRLAELQLSADHTASAVQVAHKAIALSGSRVEVQRKAWLVVADARERQGDNEEAARIRSQWRTYRG